MRKKKFNNEAVLNTVLKNYSTLRDEILVWTRAELTIVTALFSISSALVGYATISKNYTVLFILPLLTFVGVYLWLADHCMIRVLSSYISEEIEKRRLPKVIGKMNKKELWIEWDTYVQKLPRQLMGRGAGRTAVLLALLWINWVITLFFNSEVLFLEFLPVSSNPILRAVKLTVPDALRLLMVVYLIMDGFLTIYILYLSGKRYGEDLIRKT